MEVGVVVCWGDALHQSRSGWPQRRLGQLRSTPSRQTPTYRGRAGWRWLQVTRQPALMLRGGSGTHRGRGGLRRVQRGWDGPGGPVRAWTAGSWNTWRALARGETLRRVRRVEREMLSWLLVYYLFCIGGAAIGSPRHPLLT